jgi:hypothetical protein
MPTIQTICLVAALAAGCLLVIIVKFCMIRDEMIEIAERAAKRVLFDYFNVKMIKRNKYMKLKPREIEVK